MQHAGIEPLEQRLGLRVIGQRILLLSVIHPGLRLAQLALERHVAPRIGVLILCRGQRGAGLPEHRVLVLPWPPKRSADWLASIACCRFAASCADRPVADPYI